MAARSRTSDACYTGFYTLTVHVLPSAPGLLRREPAVVTTYDYGTLRSEGNAYVTESGRRYGKSCVKRLTPGQFSELVEGKDPWRLHNLISQAAKDKLKEIRESTLQPKEPDAPRERRNYKEEWMRGETRAGRRRSKWLGDYE